MARFVLIAQSRAAKGCKEEYDRWYDEIHAREICQTEGIISCRRFDNTTVSLGSPGEPSLAIFEIEAEDPAVVLTEMTRRSTSGQTTPTDALDRGSVTLWFYKER